MYVIPPTKELKTEVIAITAQFKKLLTQVITNDRSRYDRFFSWCNKYNQRSALPLGITQIHMLPNI